ncbi:MAG TPA: SGNH/GDSL hydrolase family protein [Cyclobacteriaceae bacterium]|nr:SGNH/GDSL hydrolase family protein [Cyclobacteriaceae bacterium]HRJ83293.1 SGNH/GDSL hydrolase family protein [Cyclobacteriaceae bacterium]
MEGKKEFKFLLAYGVLLGGLTLVIALLLNPVILRTFSTDGDIDPSNMARIYATRKLLFIGGGLLTLFSLLTMRSFLGRLKIAPEKPMLLITLVWLITLIELGLRLNPRYTTQEIYNSSPSYLPSPVSQHRLDPHQEAILSRKGKDTIRILANGFSTNQFDVRKKEGDIRIFVLGGSHVFDLNAANGNDWPSLAQKALHAEGYQNITIINAGVPGWRTFDMIGRVMAELHYYDPDYIILCETYNDLKYFAWAASTATPFHKLPKLIEPTHRKIGFPVRVLEKSQLYLYARDAILNFKSRPQLQQDQDYLYDTTLSDLIRPEGLEQFRINVDVFISACLAAGVTPIIATEPRLLTSENIKDISESGNFTTSTGLTLPALLQATLKCDSILAFEASRFKVPFFDLASTCSGQEGAFRDIIHYTKGGGECAGNKLKVELKALLNLQ